MGALTVLFTDVEEVCVMGGNVDIHVALRRVWYLKLWVLGVVTKGQFLGTIISLSDAMDQSISPLYPD